jgi:hypothetical protein
LFLNLVDFYFYFFQGLLDMGRFIIKKRKLDDDNESSVVGTSSGSITHSAVSVSFKTTVSQYNQNYLSFRSSSSGEEQPRPKCVVSCEKLANQAMAPSELKRHLHTNHSHLCEKPIEYFKRLTTDQTRQATQWSKITTIFDKVQEAMYDVAKIVEK